MELVTFINSGTGLITAIAALIAAIAALINAIGNYRKNRLKKADANVTKYSGKRILIKKAIFIFGIFSLFVSISIFVVRAFTGSMMIEITHPSDGSRVQITDTIEGKSKNIPQGKMIWIVVYSYPSEKYFPSHKPAQIGENGNWSSAISIGSSADSGKEFNILAYLIAENTRKELEAEFSRKDFDGLKRLPPDMLLFHRIQVFRK